MVHVPGGIQPVEADAGAHGIQVGLGQVDEGRAVGGVAQPAVDPGPAEGVQEVLEKLELPVGVVLVLLVGGGKMGVGPL